MSAVTCHFDRRGCGHETLFAGEYKRTNRTKQTKILRCFPHCCPEHISRSYCGAALSVRLDLVSPFDATQLQEQRQEETQIVTVSTHDPSAFLVFAHFEEAQTKHLHVNDDIPYDEVFRSIQTEQTPRGLWIPGKASYHSVRDRSAIYEINSDARWYYGWESAATKAQRFTKHVLRVYVFQQIRSQLRVVALATSTEFMLVSYRRAPSEVRAERQVLEALRAAGGVEQMMTLHDAKSQRTATTPIFESELESDLDPETRQISGLENAIWQERKLWECRHGNVMLASKHLTILYYFLQHADVIKFSSCLEEWGQLYGDSVATYGSSQTARSDTDRRAAAGRHSSTATLSWRFLRPLKRAGAVAAGGFTTTMDGKSHDSLARLVHICSSLAGWLVLDSANLALFRQLLQSYGDVVLNKRKLREGYVQGIRMLCELVDRFTGWTGEPSDAPSSSLSLLTEEIMTVVFQYDELRALRPMLLGILSTNAMFGMQSFVAQLRTQFLAQQPELSPNNAYLSWKGGEYASVFDGMWVFDGDRSSLAPVRGSPPPAVSLGCMLAFVRELAQIAIRPLDDQCVEIVSEWNTSTGQPNADSSRCRGNQCGMALVLDGRPRVFRNFPSGVSSLVPLDTFSYGDYRAKMMTPNCFVVEISAWPLSPSSSPIPAPSPTQLDGSPRDGEHIQPALRWKLQMQVEEVGYAGPRGFQTTERCLVVNGVGEEGYFHSRSSSHAAADFEAMSFHRKEEAVEAWRPISELSGVYKHAE